jgi:hypothetical protein
MINYLSVVANEVAAWSPVKITSDIATIGNRSPHELLERSYHMHTRGQIKTEIWCAKNPDAMSGNARPASQARNCDFRQSMDEGMRVSHVCERMLFDS